MRYLPLALALAVSLALGASPGEDQVERRLRIRQVEQVSPTELRIYAGVSELQAGVAYPIATLERSLFSLWVKPVGGQAGNSLRASSLSTFSSASPRHPRGLVIAAAGGGKASDQAAWKEAVATVLPQVFGDYLTVFELAGGGVRKLAELTPEHGENLKILQRQITAADSAVEPGPLGLALCPAAERFAAWAPGLAGPGSQKVLLLVVPGSSAAAFSTSEQLCWKALLQAQVTIYLVAYHAKGQWQALRGDIERSGGFIHEVGGPQDTFRALSNIAANLSDEYVLDVPIASGGAPLTGFVEVSAQASYHGNLVRSLPWSFKLKDLSAASTAQNRQAAAEDTGSEVVPEAPQADLDDADLAGAAAPSHDALLWAASAVALMCLVAGLRLLWTQRRSLHFCQLCQTKVAQDDNDCPLTSPACVARLVLVAAAKDARKASVKRLIPLSEGQVVIGSGRGCQIRLQGYGLRCRHATVTLSHRRALVESHTPRADRADGWIITEPRLLANGTILRLGRATLRFEARPE